MRKFFFGLAILPSLVFSQAYDTAINVGPGPISNSFTGRIAAIACSKTSNQVVYVGAADGGVWKTTNAGASWSVLTDFVGCTAVGAIAVDQVDHNIVYVGTGEANYANHSRYGIGILKSTDGGAHWTNYGNATFRGRTFSKIVIDPGNRNTLYASVGRAGGFPALSAAKNHPDRNGPVGIFKSTDAGVTWTQLLGGLPNEAGTDVAIAPGTSNILYACIGNIFGSSLNGIYKSTDSGASWSKLSGGLATSSVGRVNMAVAPSNSNQLYALMVNVAGADGGTGTTLAAFQSSNAGSTWTALSSIGSFQQTYGWYLSTVSVRPSSASTVLMGGFSLESSTNTGASWSDITPPHVDMHALDWDASGNLWAGCDGGVFYSSNLGGSWTTKNNGISVIQFYPGISVSPSNANHILGGMQDNGTALRTNTGNTWNQGVGGDGGWTRISPTNGANMLGEYQGAGNLYRSTNSGGVFNFSGSGINTGDRNCFLPPFVYDLTNTNNMFYGTQRMYKSTNGGASWAAISGDVTLGAGAIRSISVAPSNASRIYITTNDGLLRMSNNGGVSFTTVKTGLSLFPRVTHEIVVDPANDQHFWLAVPLFGSDQLVESTNAGATFSVKKGNLPDVPVNVFGLDTRDTPNTWYVGTDDGIFRSKNEGANWARSKFPRCCVNDIVMDLGRNRAVVGTQGRGAWIWALPKLVK